MSKSYEIIRQEAIDAGFVVTEIHAKSSTQGESLTIAITRADSDRHAGIVRTHDGMGWRWNAAVALGLEECETARSHAYRRNDIMAWVVEQLLDKRRDPRKPARFVDTAATYGDD